ncbi:hypothetical protein BSK33_18085 [Geobacillus sp. 44B]|nr:hypothetical protein BSK33_18085 [Geobacillus sp. 44B]
MHKYKVYLTDAKKVGHFTLEIEGFLGSNLFRARLEGVALNILTPHPMNEDEVQELEDAIRERFPMPYGRGFNKTDIKKGLNNFPRQILIGEIEIPD